MKKIIIYCFFLAITACLLVGCGDESANGSSDPKTSQNISSDSVATQELPDAKTLNRLAQQALKNIHSQKRVGFVEIVGDFPDGSKRLKVFLEDGRYTVGRLFKDRVRYRIAIDSKDFYASEENININIKR